MANPNDIITLDCVGGMRREGDVVAGFVNVNPALAMEKDVTSVRVSLKAEAHTWVTVSTGQTTVVHRGKEVFLDIEHVLWTPETLVQPLSSGFAALPFSINIPVSSQSQSRLPASFHCGSSHTGAKIQYYVHAVAVRKSWYQRNKRLNFVFPFLPLDYTPAPYTQFNDWPGGWNVSRKTEDMKSNVLKIFSAPAIVECQMLLPTVASIPLFKPIPVRVVVTCKSKLMPTASSMDPSTFEFPRIPKASEVDVNLTVLSRINARSLKRNLTTDMGLVGGFGLPNDLSLRAQWSSAVKADISAPQWLPDYEKANKGRWIETVTFHSTLLFRCPTPIQSQIITSTVNLDVKVHFPGLGNNLKMMVGPIPLSSGFSATQPMEHNMNPVNLDLPPSYWDVVEVEEKGAGDMKKG